jgi:putative hydrolase of the HAD superfamily
MGTVSAVLFDADGVIQLAPVDLHLRLTEALGRTPLERELCMSEIFAAEAPALTGAAAFEVDLEAVLRRLDATCDVETVLNHWRMIEAHQPILTMIRELRSTGVYCAIASNQERNRARHMSEALGYYEVFEREFYSCDLGHTKPSPRYFEEIVHITNFEPSQMLFIDDRLENVEAARRCGLAAEQFVLWKEDDGADALGRILRRHGLTPSGGVSTAQVG